MLHHAVELLLDAEAEAGIRAIWERLRTEGISSTMLDLGARPHVTLAVYNALDPQAFHAPAAAFFEAEQAFDVTFSSAGTFPGGQNVAFVAPVVTERLLGMHARFHGRFADHDDEAWPYYRPGAWVPHTTVGIALEEIAVPYALDLARAGLPVEGRVESASLFAFESGNLRPVEQLYELRLGG